MRSQKERGDTSMKIKVLAVLGLILSVTFNAFCAQIQLSGIYKGKNLYVQNPFSGNMKDFCTLEVYVNGTMVKSKPQSSAYEIDLSHLKLNDPVVVKIVHKDDCKPKVLNPQVIRKLSDFGFVSFTGDQYNIAWSTKGETIGGVHYLEHYSKGAWITLFEISGHTTSSIANYKHSVKHHSGLNKYRVRYLSKSHRVTFSKEIEYTSDVEPITFYPKRVSKNITLSRSSSYEIMDAFGSKVKEGKGKLIDCSSLKSGFYYLNINNQTEKFLKK